MLGFCFPIVAVIATNASLLPPSSSNFFSYYVSLGLFCSNYFDAKFSSWKGPISAEIFGSCLRYGRSYYPLNLFHPIKLSYVSAHSRGYHDRGYYGDSKSAVGRVGLSQSKRYWLEGLHADCKWRNLVLALH